MNSHPGHLINCPRHELAVLDCPEATSPAAAEPLSFSASLLHTLK
jgi:hypothetical protein